MSMNFVFYRKDGNEMVPIDGGVEAMNLNNRNAVDLGCKLGLQFDPDWGFDPVEIETLIDRCHRLLRQSIGNPDKALETVELQPNMIDCGREAGYIQNRTRQLVEQAKIAQNLGATHLYVS